MPKRDADARQRRQQREQPDDAPSARRAMRRRRVRAGGVGDRAPAALGGADAAGDRAHGGVRAAAALAGASAPSAAVGAVGRRPSSGRSVGKRMTSRIESAPVSSITSRSMPMPEPAGRRQAVLERADVVVVDRLGLLVAAGLQLRLGLEALAPGRPGR